MDTNGPDYSQQVRVLASKQLQCASSERNLCNAVRDGLKLWCRSRGFAHLFSWQQLDAIRAELAADNEPKKEHMHHA